MGGYFHSIVTNEYFRSLTATAIVVILLTIVVAAIRSSDWDGPMDIVGYIERILGTGKSKSGAEVLTKLRNIELRGPTGSLMSFPCVDVLLRNGGGKQYELKNSIFPVDNPDMFKAGTPCVLMVADLDERCTVQIDPEHHTLFIQSKTTRAEWIDRINHVPSPGVK